MSSQVGGIEGRGSDPGPVSPVEDPRIYLAAERTFLAWIRTAVALMGFGFVIARFGLLMRESGLFTTPPRPNVHHLSPFLGVGMVGVGVFVAALAAGRHLFYIKALRAGVANPPLSVGAPLFVAVVLAIVGLVMSVHLLSV